jgi:hypothetical protein
MRSRTPPGLLPDFSRTPPGLPNGRDDGGERGRSTVAAGYGGHLRRPVRGGRPAELGSGLWLGLGLG